MRNRNTFYNSLEVIVQQAQNNDYKALEELVRRFQKKIYTMLLYLNKKDENISDLTQEVLIRMIKSLPGLKNPKAFKSWLNHIVLNIFYDNMRKKQKKPDILSIENEESYYQIPDRFSLPLDKAIFSEADRKIQQEIKNLPKPFKIAIIMRELQGLTYEEIAIATNTNIGTVKSRIARAREKLQYSLKNYI